MSLFWVAILASEVIALGLALVWWRGRSKVH